MKVLQEFETFPLPQFFLVIEEFLKSKILVAGEMGLFSAMGPGFSSDIILFTTT